MITTILKRGFVLFNSQTFAERLKSARSKKRLSQAELAKAVGVSAATISSYETPNGTKIPALDKAAAIAAFLEVPLDYLCGGDIPSTPITDFDLETYLRSLVAVISETSTDFFENANNGDLNITISHPAITDFISKCRDLLKVYRDGSLTRDLYISCIEKVISDVCKNYSLVCSAVLSDGECLDFDLTKGFLLDNVGEIGQGLSEWDLKSDPTANESKSRKVTLYFSEKDVEKCSSKKGGGNNG